MVYGWYWCFNVGSSVIKKFTSPLGDTDNGGNYDVRE